MTARLEYIEVFYNRQRRYSALNYKSPVQFLDDWLIAKTGSMTHTRWKAKNKVKLNPC